MILLTSSKKRATRVAEEREAAAERRLRLEVDRERTLRAAAESVATSLRGELAGTKQQAAARALAHTWSHVVEFSPVFVLIQTYPYSLPRKHQKATP
jgi:hypothetical protein